MGGIRFWAVSLLAGAMLVSSAAAEDMNFTIEETGQKSAPAKLGPPSKTLAEALSLYESKKYEDAAVQLKQVVDGKTKVFGEY